MGKFSNISIVASFFGLWIVSFFSSKIQIILGFLLIFSFGILHGANDLLLIYKNNSTKKTPDFIKSLINYVLVIILCALLFYLIPWLTLLLFIIVSAYHFGEQQWKELINNYPKWIWNTIFLTYGMFIFSLLFLFHAQEVENIVYEITNVKISKSLIPLLFNVVGITFIVTLSLSYYIYESLRRKILTELFYLLVFAIIFKASSLIWGFALYFILWHSIPSIIEQMNFLYGKLSIQNFMSYCKSAALYWFISIVGIILLYLLLKDKELFNAIFFSFLAAITFPHVVVITKIFNRK
ncbi:Brp/Blh family beta-carotene 15,15'-dioxygenase [Flavobacterium sp.]|uniref:Brp/Blh family beta-carotene 15,15'-dioxygenase n=1 Tax=Flavobacterium sp. TaxID=239 RepID=UPI0038D20116